MLRRAGAVQTGPKDQQRLPGTPPTALPFHTIQPVIQATSQAAAATAGTPSKQINAM